MATVVLVRHGRTTANASGVLAGRSPGVKLDEVGQGQAARTAERLAVVPLAAVVSSPLVRCRQTAAAITGAQAGTVEAELDKAITECDYGEWQGRPLKELAKEKLWASVQRTPSSVTFPGGESMRAMQMRGVDAVRRHDAAIEAAHGPEAVWVAVSHGDVIKSILAEALGTHLDLFQRLHVDPASVSVVRISGGSPSVLCTNTHAGDLGWLVPPKKPGRRRRGAAGPADAVVGGGAGPGTA
ncbi:MSMEG_4193 family putative phosphomutase [uncultured Nocardioides sp.]|uniref:MSMEG_4193 family putative phosphomutase n=1 Tax=uncultured Nocardioides sp. TaxID=198441 RepID=UPI002608A486|nr:MSMEG_4193 family putative phosphomutase [uncultured Nocardioides sp.]